MIDITSQQIADALSPYGSVSSITHKNIKTYIDMLIQWNKKISLTAIVDPIQIARLHFGESIFAASAVPIWSGRLADVGTGAGFPGIPLRMVAPNLDLTLIEPNTKKSAFLSEVVRKLDLGSSKIIRTRMEDIPIEHEPFDFITARALGRHDDFLEWSIRHLGEAGQVILWVGETDAKVISLKSNWHWREPIPIPQSERRQILVGRPIR